MPETVGIYCRISKDDAEGQGLGVTRQEKDCRSLAEHKKWQVGEVFTDNDVSAYSGKRRPAYERMLDALRSGTIDGVVCWHLDRLTRRPAELETFFDVCDKAGVKSLATVTGDIDLGTDDGRFFARIMGAAARKESDDHARRKRAKHLELAQEGKPVGGFRAFGYENDKITIRPDEAALIRDAAQSVLAGESIRQVVKDWNGRGLTGPRGGRWTQTSLRKILVSPRVAGLRSLSGEVIAEAVWPAILDRATWERVRSTLDSRRTQSGFGARSYLLSGFCRCGRCDARMVSQPRTNRRRSYTCPMNPDKDSCGGIRVVSEPLESLVVEAVMQRLDTPELAEAIKDRELPEGDDRNDALEIEDGTTQLEELARLWGERRITAGEWAEARKPIERRLDAARRRIAARTQTQAVAPFLGGQGALRAAWESMSFDKRRAVLEAVIAAVVVGSAVPGVNKFDPERVNVEWRA
jgi:site-specific DNA recombinase